METKIIQVGDRLRLGNSFVSVSEKTKDDGSTVRWAQLSRKDQRSGNWDNFTMFASDLKELSYKLEEILSRLEQGGVEYGTQA